MTREKKGQAAALKRILHDIRPYWVYLALSLLTAAFSVATQLYVPILTGDAIDEMIGQGAVNLAGVAVICRNILAHHRRHRAEPVDCWACATTGWCSVSPGICGIPAMDKLQSLPIGTLDAHSTGDLLSRMVADVDQFADGLLMGFTQLFTGVLTILGTLIFMLALNRPITLVVVLVTPLSLVVAGFIAKHTYMNFQLQNKVRGRQTGFINEMVEGQSVVRAFGRETRTLEEFDEINAELQQVSQKAVFLSSLTNPATRFVNSLVYAGVGLVGALSAIGLIPGNTITVGQLSVLPELRQPVHQALQRDLRRGDGASECPEPVPRRVFELLDDASPVSPTPADARALAADEVDGTVALRDVSFRYVPDRPLIEHFDSGRAARPAGGHRRPHRLRQDHPYQPADALLRCGRRRDRRSTAQRHPSADPGLRLRRQLSAWCCRRPGS